MLGGPTGRIAKDVCIGIVHNVNHTHRELDATEERAQALKATLTATRRLHTATEELLDAAAERYGINRNDLRCLEILERDGPTQPGTLADASGLSPAAITKVLDRLERAGYITTTRDRPDRRTRYVQTSGQQLQQRRQIWQPVSDAASLALADQNAPQLDALATSILRLAEAHNQSARRMRGGHLMETIAPRGPSE